MVPGKKYAPEDFLRVAWRRRWFLLVPLVVASIGTFLYSWSLPNRYRSEALVLIIPQQVPENIIRPTVDEPVSQRLDLMRQQILSRARLERIIEEFELYKEERKELLMDQVIAFMRTEIEITPQRVGRRQDPNHFIVRYDSENPQTAMRVAERLASLFVQENLQGRNLQSAGTAQFLQSQVDQSLRQLQQHEAQLEAFKRANAGKLPDEVQTNLELMDSARLQIQTLSDGINRDRERQIVVERLINDEKSMAPAAPAASRSSSPERAQVTQTIAQQLATARATLDGMLLRFKEDHPDVRIMRGRIRDLERRAEAEALLQPVTDGTRVAVLSPAEIERQRRISSLSGELESLDRGIKSKQDGIERAQATLRRYEASVQAAPGLQSQMAELMRDYGTVKTSYETLLKKLQDAKLAASLEERQVSQQFRIIDPARRPERPHSPDRLRMNLIGALLGLGLGIAIAALLEYRDTSLRTEDDVLVALSLPVLALVPTMRTRKDESPRRRRLLLGSSAAVMVVASLAAVVWKLRLFDVWGR